MGTVSVMMCKALADKGNHVTLYIGGTHDPDPNLTLKNKYGITPMDTFHLHVVPKSFIKKLSKFAIRLYIKAFFDILRKAKKKKPLIVISRNTNFLPFMWLITRLTNAHVFFESHGFHNRAKSERKWFGIVPNVKMLQPWLYEKTFLPKISGVFCMTQRQSRLYKAIFPGISSIALPLGSPEITATESEQKNPEHKNLVYCGRYVGNIDADTMLSALSMCKGKGVQLTWFGLKDNQMQELQERASIAGVSDCFFPKGWIAHGELRKRLPMEFDIGLATYKYDYTSAVLVCPTKIFDYYAAGLPVIGSNISTVKDILRHGQEGLIYKTGDPESLARCIEQLVGNSELYDKSKKNALTAARYYSWGNRAERFLAFAEKSVA